MKYKGKLEERRSGAGGADYMCAIGSIELFPVSSHLRHIAARLIGFARGRSTFPRRRKSSAKKGTTLSYSLL